MRTVGDSRCGEVSSCDGEHAVVFGRVKWMLLYGECCWYGICFFENESNCFAWPTVVAGDVNPRVKAVESGVSAKT